MQHYNVDGAIRKAQITDVIACGPAGNAGTGTVFVLAPDYGRYTDLPVLNTRKGGPCVPEMGIARW